MKKHISLLIMMLWVTAMANAQAIHVFHDNMAKADVYLNVEVDSIKINSSSDCAEYDEYLLYTTTGLVKYDVAKVDSIKFNMPYLKVLPGKGRCQIPTDADANVNFYVYSSSRQVPIMRMQGDVRLEVETWYQFENNNLYRFSTNTNELYDDREGYSEEKWYVEDGESRDSIGIEFTGRPIFENQWHNVGIPAEASEFKLKPLLDNVKLGDKSALDGSNLYDFNSGDLMATWDYDEDGDIIIRFRENDSSEKRWSSIAPHTDYIDCPWGNFVQYREKFKHSSDEHMQALKDFYNSTSMKDLDTNWFTDIPLWQWDFSINRHKWSDFYWHITDHVTNFYTGGGQYTGITGTLPPSFEVFLDDIHHEVGTLADGELDLTSCALYGKIPQNIKDNPNWQEKGWGIIPQSVWCGGGFDLEGHSNLYLDDSEVEDFVTGQTSTVYDVLSKNKLTWVFNGGAVDIIDGISDQRVNKYLDYRDKGLGLVVTVGIFWTVPYDNYRNYVLNERERNGLPDDILWTKGFDKADVGSYGSMSLINETGELVWYVKYDGGLPDDFYLDQIDEICRQYFGEPLDHPIYESHLYESSDFSHDGEVMILQQASVGKGIPLVLTGDSFIDKDFEEGGAFDEQMKEAMEQFFSVEPYTSLRNRFTVYAVKAVSVNDYRGSNHVFNNDDMKVMEYVNKIPSIDLDNVTVAVIEYNPNFQFFDSGYTTMQENGASIAYLQAGNASDIIVHEAGGHGFAKLLDEYIYGGCEDNKISDEELDEFKEYINGYYHDREWGMNISTTDNTDEVPWHAFMMDSRYENEIGIYQGAWFYPYDLWRSSENSIMKETGFHEFNAPSREAIYKRVMRLSEGEDWTYDYETFVAFDQQTRQQARKVRKASDSSERMVIHKSPKLRRMVDGRIEDIPSPFNDEKVAASLSIKNVQKQGRDRVLIKNGQVM